MRAWLLALVALFITSAGATAADHPANWSRPAEPFRVIGNVYYVGTEGLSAFLVTGPQGHVLIDGGLPSSAPLIAANVRKLGFRLADVKLLLINHAHYDHAGGLAELKRLTGARLLASAGDKPDLEAVRTISRPDIESFPPVAVDQVISDGDRISVGPITLTALLTPGHTAGATSWLTSAEGKTVIFTSSVTVAGQPLVDNPAYPQAAADFRRTFVRLKAVKADVFLNFHAESFDLEAKRNRLNGGDPNAFVDPEELGRRISAAEQAFEAEMVKQVSGRQTVE